MVLPFLKLVSCFSIFALLDEGFCRGDEPTVPANETGLVLRISKEFIRNHAPPTFNEVQSIDRCMFGARVTGQSNTSGRLQIEMEPHDRDAVFTLLFSGTSSSKTVATRQPVEVYQSGKTEFELERKISFDGLRFRESPITIKSKYSSSFDGLRTPRGVRGLIASRVAISRVTQLQPESDAIALQDTTNQVVAGFNVETDQLLTQLNKLVPIDRTINLFVPKTKDWIYHLGSTKDYIFASPGPKDANIPVLPKEAAHMRAPVELWIRGKPKGESARQALETWTFVHRQLDKFRAAQANKESKPQDIAFTAVGEWWVLKIGEDLADDWMKQMDKKTGK